MNIPIVFLIFNRPELTRKVFSIIRMVQPRRLFIVADGPRLERPGEISKCQEARKIIDKVDWECDVKINISDQNLGCKMRIFTGLSWVFNYVDKAIILEDDCLPNYTFFLFCEELLNYYQNNKEIMAINGQNIQFGRRRSFYSYYFSKYFHTWGWATWRRAWQTFDIDMRAWPSFYENGGLSKIVSSPREIAYWKKIFELSYQNKIDSWGYPWFFNCWLHNFCVVTPEVNLVSNIGFGEDATHTRVTRKQNLYAEMPARNIKFPLQHPPKISLSKEADRFSQITHFNPNLFTKLKFKFSQTLKS